MHLFRLHLHAIRNLQETALSFHTGFNIVAGDNGSGKTSLLEAIHLLALGRSFRSRQVHSVIHRHASSLACFGEVMGAESHKIALGIEKSREGEVICKIQGEICQRLSDFASLLPLQLVTPESFRLLVAGAEERRRFLDWGVFHVEHSFAALCQTYHRALKQRNAALKAGYSASEMRQWEQMLAESGEKIALLRGTHLAALQPFVQEACSAWLPNHPIEMIYQPGWEKRTLEEALNAVRGKDSQWGFTSVGPHRAEWLLRMEGFPVAQILSRGQQKLLVLALYIAQAQLLIKQLNKRSLFLIDDLASELDPANRMRVLKQLHQQGHQVFMTAIEPSSLECSSLGIESRMFHVEHGAIRSAT